MTDLPTLRARLQRCPGDWPTALALKQALAAAGRYAESDPAFVQARRLFPDAVWLAHLAALHAFPQAELPELTARARAARAPPRLLGDLLRQGRHYVAAAEAYAAAGPDAEWLAYDCRRAEALAARLTIAPATGPTPSIAIINLDRNPGRLAETEAWFAGCAPPRFRIPGVEGSRLSTAAARRLGADPAMRGTLGCFLSHTAAWEAMLARGLAHCLVVEDDVIPLLDLPRHWGVFGLPDGFDVCFVNDRLAPWTMGVGFEVWPLADAMQAFPPEENAAGADGYLLSAAGAHKLLAWVAEDGFAGDVDWRMVGYGMGDVGLPPGHAREALGRLRPGIGRAERLAAFVLTPPLIRTVPIASDREDENRAVSPQGR